MAHAHSLYDTDPHFRIEPSTRSIINMSGKTIIVQHDHNSERFTFEIPRYVDGHDMSLCNNVEIHYINGNSNQKTQGLYKVDDLQIDPNDDTYVICSWLISHNATQYIGPLSFLVRFECLTDTTIDYAWSTGVHTGIAISQGIYNTDYVVEEYADILEQWHHDLEAAGVTMTGIEQTTTSTEDGGVNEITMTFSDGSSGTFTIQNGSKGDTGASIDSIARTSGDGTAGTTDVYTVTLTDGGTSTFRVYNGADGAYIESIVRTSGNGAPGTTDVYTIRLTDGSAFTFNVYNGADGAGVGDMTEAVYDPQGKKTDVFAYIDNAIDDVESSIPEYTETDPTVPAWAKETTKPSYTYDEVGADKSGSADAVQKNLATHAASNDIHVTASEKSKWNAKQNALTFDSSPTSGSSNPVTSDGLYVTLKNITDTIGDISELLDTINGEVV